MSHASWWGIAVVLAFTIAVTMKFGLERPVNERGVESATRQASGQTTAPGPQ